MRHNEADIRNFTQLANEFNTGFTIQLIVMSCSDELLI